MNDVLAFVIYPDGEYVSLDLFQRTLRNINAVVKDVDYAITREKGVRRWVIERLQSSVPTIKIKPLLEQPEIVEAIFAGVKPISQGMSEPPSYFTEDALAHLKRMNRLFVGRDRLSHLDFSLNGSEPAVVASDIGDRVDKILRGGYSSLGSLEGMLEEVNLHGIPTFTIWDRVSKAPVRCYFPKERSWKEKVKDLLETRVLVRGKVNYFCNGVPRSISDIKELEDRTHSPGLPRATFGSIFSEDAARDAVSFLDEVRQGG